MRDSQRSKVYKAERELPEFHEAPHFPHIESVKSYVLRVQNHPALIKKYGEFLSPHIHVGDGRARRSAGGNAQGIWMPKWSRKKIVILHELAHVISSRKYRVRWVGTTADKIAGHGWQFCEVYLDLVRAMLGNANAEALKASFKKNKVRFRPKRELSPERLEQLRERGRALALSRQAKVEAPKEQGALAAMRKKDAN